MGVTQGEREREKKMHRPLVLHLLTADFSLSTLKNKEYKRELVDKG